MTVKEKCFTELNKKPLTIEELAKRLKKAPSSIGPAMAQLYFDEGRLDREDIGGKRGRPLYRYFPAQEPYTPHPRPLKPAKSTARQATKAAAKASPSSGKTSVVKAPMTLAVPPTAKTPALPSGKLPALVDQLAERIVDHLLERVIAKLETRLSQKMGG